MPEVDLKLVADVNKYISAIRQVMGANQEMYSQAAEGAKKERGYIKDIQEALDELRMAQRRAGSKGEKDAYAGKIMEANKALKEAKENLKGYEKELKEVDKAQKNATKSTDILKSGFMKLVGVVGGAVGAWKLFESVMKSTDATGDWLRKQMEGLKGAVGGLFRTIASGDFSNLITNMKNGYQASKEYTEGLIEIEHRQRSLNLQTLKQQTEMTELLNKVRQTEGLTIQEREDALEQYSQMNKEILNDRKKLAEDLYNLEVETLQKRLNLTDDQVKLLTKYAEDYNKLSQNELQEVKNLDAAYTDWIGTHDKLIQKYGNLNAASQQEYDDLVAKEEMYRKMAKSISKTASDYSQLGAQIKLFTGEQRDAVVKAATEVAKVEADFYMAERWKIRYQEQMLREKNAAIKKAQDEEKARLKAFNDEVAKLQDNAVKAEIANLEGTDKIKAEYAYNLQQIENLEKHLRSMGNLTAEHYALLNGLRDNALMGALKQEADYYNKRQAKKEEEWTKEKAAEKKHQEEMKKLLNDVLLAEADILDDTGAARLEILINNKQAEIIALQAAGDEMSLLQARLGKTELDALVEQQAAILGQSEEGWEVYVNAAKVAYNEITNALGQIFAAEVSHWERQRSLMDTKIAETQRMVEAETELHKAGYASNIQAKQEEVEALQKEREKVLEQEEKAIKAQQLLATIQQTTALVTAAANLWSLYSLTNPALAIALIATMFGSFAAAKIKAKETVGLAEGGSGTETGMITGKKHSQGGEKFLDHVEVERGEHWGVLAANRSPKYAMEFHRIVDAMNKGTYKPAQMRGYFPTLKGNKYGREEMLGIKTEVSKLNDTMKDKTDIIELSDRTIIKRNNYTRIIRK